jgi:hypothetical protein
VEELVAAAYCPRYQRRLDREGTAWIDWCAARGYPPVPAEPWAVEMYLSGRAGKGPCNLDAVVTAIAAAHRRAGVASPLHQHGWQLLPEIRAVLAGIRGEARDRSPAPTLTAAGLRRFVTAPPETSQSRTRAESLSRQGALLLAAHTLWPEEMVARLAAQDVVLRGDRLEVTGPDAGDGSFPRPVAVIDAEADPVQDPARVMTALLALPRRSGYLLDVLTSSGGPPLDRVLTVVREAVAGRPPSLSTPDAQLDLRARLLRTDVHWMTWQRAKVTLLLGLATAEPLEVLTRARLVTVDRQNAVLAFPQPRGASRTITVAQASDPRLCLVRAVQEWVVAAGIEEGGHLLSLLPGRRGAQDAVPSSADARTCLREALLRTGAMSAEAEIDLPIWRRELRHLSAEPVLVTGPATATGEPPEATPIADHPLKGTDFAPAIRPATRAGYRASFRRIAQWSARQGGELEPTHPETLCLFLAAQEDLAWNTLANVVRAVNRECFDQGLPVAGDSWRVKLVMKALRRTHRSRRERRAFPLDGTTLERLVARLDRVPSAGAALLVDRVRAAVLGCRSAEIPLERVLGCRPEDAWPTETGMALRLGGLEAGKGNSPPAVVQLAPRDGDLDPVGALDRLKGCGPQGRGLLFGVQACGGRRRAESDPRALSAAVLRQVRRAARLAGHPEVALLPFVTAGMTDEEVRVVLAELDPHYLRRLRDAALICVAEGSGALRPAALPTLRLERIRPRPDGGYDVFVGPHKYERVGFWTGVLHSAGCGPACPACRLGVLLSALERRGIVSGPLFATVQSWTWSGRRMSGDDVGRVVRLAARAAGLGHLGISGRSMRRGAITTFARAGASEGERMQLGRHRSRPVANRYVDPGVAA